MNGNALQEDVIDCCQLDSSQVPTVLEGVGEKIFRLVGPEVAFGRLLEAVPVKKGGKLPWRRGLLDTLPREAFASELIKSL